jgi:hypothetical protein
MHELHLKLLMVTTDDFDHEKNSLTMKVIENIEGNNNALL